MTYLQLNRKEAGLTQKQLAERSGVNLKMIQKYETGEKDINHARAITIWRLAFALGCPMTHILEATPEFHDAFYYIQAKSKNETK